VQAKTRVRALKSLEREPPLRVISPAKKRQMEAIFAAPSREAALRGIAARANAAIPTLVIRECDPLFGCTAARGLTHCNGFHRTQRKNKNETTNNGCVCGHRWFR
jgi:hypothetical protein